MLKRGKNNRIDTNKKRVKEERMGNKFMVQQREDNGRSASNFFASG
jgi:hypothetical protein